MMQCKKEVKILVKKKLPWRSTYLNDLFMELGKRTEKRRRWRQKGGALSMKRKEGVENTREEPLDSENFASMDFEEP